MECTYPSCQCVVRTSTNRPYPKCPKTGKWAEPPRGPEIKPMPAAHNFNVPLDEWEDAVFLAAVEFRVGVYTIGQPRSEPLSYQTYPEAKAAADRMGSQAMVYAVTKAGRYFLIERKKWPHFDGLWQLKIDSARAIVAGAEKLPKGKRNE